MMQKSEKIKSRLFKIPSGEITNIPLLKYIASQNKKTILSTGMSTINEVDTAYKTLLRNGLKKKLIILQCTSAYPTPVNELNLNTILFLRIDIKSISDYQIIPQEFWLQLLRWA